MRYKLGMAGALFASCCLLASAQNSTSDQHMDSGSNKMMKSADTHFATAAAQGGLAEVQLGQLAQQKAADQKVKDFGQKMVDDHTKANDELKSVAESEGMTLPAGLNAKDEALKTKLQGLSGPAFDKAYMKAMVKDHQEDVKEFQKEANSGKDPKMKEFAAKTLPVLQGHLDMAKSTEASVGK